MNKSLLTLGLLTAISAGASAQAVYGYDPVVTRGTYTPLTAATVIYDGATASDEHKGENLGETVFTASGIADSETTEADGYDIGFTFPMAGKNMSKFVVSGSGWVAFGNDKVPVDVTATSFFFDNEGKMDVVGCVPMRGSTGLADTEISYQTVGQDADAVLVIQFKNFGVKKAFWGDEGLPVDMQLRIASNGDWSVVYSGFSVFEDFTPTFKCGIGVDGSFKYVCESINEISSRVSGSENLSIPSDTADGTTLTFKAPETCVTPSAGATGLILDSTSTSISGSFTASDTADTYLVLYTTKEGLDWTPVDGQVYDGNSSPDDMTIVQFGPELEFHCEDLSGGTRYYFLVYAAKSYGFDGPKYNVTDVLKGEMATKPAAPAAEIVAAGSDSLTLKITGNEADDDVVVLLTSYCLRDNYGDNGLFGTLSGDVKVGDVLPVPEDYSPMIPETLIPAPEDGGKVVYVGAEDDDLIIKGLDNSTLYYLSVYSRDKDMVYSTTCVDLSGFTVIEAPYEGNGNNFPRYALPAGWTTNEPEDEGFRDETFYNFREGTISQGTQVVQQTCKLNHGSADGVERWLALSPVKINGRHLVARFDYYITESSGRFDTHAYNSWAEGDELEMLVSKDNGTTWESVAKYVPGTNPQQEEMYSVVSIEADLNSYRNETVLVKLRWKTFTTASWGAKICVDRFTLKEGEYPDIPEVSVGNVTYDTAVVSWKSTQTDYELSYKASSDEDYTTVKVEGASVYTLTGLVPVTEYEVKVRGILEGEELYSEWSDPVVFSTMDWPAVAAPTDLESDVTGFEDGGTVVLKWKGTEEMISYEVSYRKSSETTWTEVQSSDPTVTLTGLDYETRYIWKVLAHCTHDRVTEYSAQASFETPMDYSGVANLIAESANAQIYTLAGVKVNKSKKLDAGVYVVRVNGKTMKVVVR